MKGLMHHIIDLCKKNKNLITWKYHIKIQFKLKYSKVLSAKCSKTTYTNHWHWNSLLLRGNHANHCTLSSYKLQILFCLSAHSWPQVAVGCPPRWKHPVGLSCFGMWGSHTAPPEHWLGRGSTALSPVHCPADMRTPGGDKICLDQADTIKIWILG